MKTKFFLLIAAVFLCFSCKSMQVKDVVPFDAIGPNADIYLYMPTNGNMEIFDTVLAKHLDRNDIKTILKRTDAVYVGLLNGVQQSVQADLLACAVGHYPKNTTDMIFKGKNGWTKYTAKNKAVYYCNNICGVSIPNKKNAFLSLTDEPEASMENFIEQAKNNEPVAFSETFDSFVKNTKQDGLGIFMKNPLPLFTRIIGTDLQFPLKQGEVYIIKDDDKNYTYNMIIETATANTAKALKFLVQMTLNTEVTTDGVYVLIKNGILPKEQLLAILNKLL